MRNWKLSVKLPLLIVIAATLTVIAVIVPEIYILTGSITASENEANLSSLRDYANAIEFYLADARSTIEITAQEKGLTDIAPAAGQPELTSTAHTLAQSILAHSYAFQYLMLLDKDGSIIALEPHEFKDTLLRKDLANTAWYKKLVSSGQTVISDLNISPVTQRPSVVVATPIFDSAGVMTGIWAGGLNLVKLSQLGSATLVANLNQHYGYITDSRGLIIAHQAIPSYVEDQTDFSTTPPIKAALSGKQGTMRFVSTIDGIEKLGAYSQLPGTNWAVAYVVPVSIAFEPINKLTWYLAGLGFLMIIFMGVGSLLITLQITGPLKQLTAATAKIGGGDLGQRIQITGKDELGQLGSEFNRMAVSLQTQVIERRKAEEEKLKAESQATASRTTAEMIEAIPDPVFANDMQGKITQFNRAVTELLGYGQEIIGELPTVLVTESEVPRAMEVIKEIVEVGFLHNKEFTLKAMDGRQIPVLLNGVLRKDQDGNPVGMVAVLRDITEIKKAEETLKESEERFRVASASASDTIWEWDIPSGRLDWYGKIDEILGYQPGEFPRTIDAWEKAIHTDDIGHVNAKLEQHLKEGTPYADEYRIQRKDGTYCYWVDHGTALRNAADEPVKMIGACSDITERKTRELEYQTILRTATDGFWLVDMQGHFLNVNQSYCSLTGYSYDELMNMAIPDIEVIEQPEDVAKRIKKIMEVGSDRFETRHRRKDGRILEVEVSVNYLPIDNGRMCVFTRDITERKKAEKRLAESTEQLQRSNAELQSFAYVASHDLQEPLRTISSYMQLLEKRYKAKLDKDAREFIDFAVTGANRLQIMIGGLLEYSRVETRGDPFEMVNCESVLEHVVRDLKKVIEDSKAEITHDPLPGVFADQVQLTRLFQNLIANSIRYHGSEPPRIHISAAIRDGEYVFAVRDNGIGIDPEYKEQIFVIFQRLHGREVPGIGLGLAVAKKIVERHGGRIWLESEPGKGATFYFTIPIKGGNQ
jgi:PAS domain S-box-containing protein